MDVDDNVFQDQPKPKPQPLSSSSSSCSSSPTDVVHYTCAKPPDILDFTRPSLPDIELEEEVAITIDGIQIVQEQTEEEAEVELPDHIQAMVNKAMKDIQWALITDQVFRIRTVRTCVWSQSYIIIRFKIY